MSVIPQTVFKTKKVLTVGGKLYTRRGYAPLPIDPLARFRAIAEATEQKPRVLITGSLGQLGRGLNTVFKYMYGNDCVTMTDIVKVPFDASDVCKFFYNI
uniref:Epimerase domain-containing protein n=1 Tax=Heterorhabditis bacteriophora TaxID=37862 RepID=A0A1I7XP03_HETBA